MIGRLLRKTDFERVLAVPLCSRSAHFAVHHLKARPSPPLAPAARKLCTGDAPNPDKPVGNLGSGHWLGCVIPKRHAARAVTRNMLRRQMRETMQRHAEALSPGLWVVRLRQPFPKADFPSADSAALRATATTELERLFQRAR